MVVKKKVVIFGATGGIGKEIVSVLSSTGYEIFKERVDVTDKNALLNYAKKLENISIVIYCVGKINTQSIMEIDIDNFKSIFEVNVFGAVNVTKALLPIIKDKGHFIFISSIRALKSSKNRSAYCSSKAALDMFAKILRKETNNRVTIIRPGYVDTNLYGGEQLYPYSIKTKKRMKIIQPRDIAKTILFVLESSEGCNIKELNLGEVFKDRTDICFLK